MIDFNFNLIIYYVEYMRRNYFYRAYAKELINYLNYLNLIINLTLGASLSDSALDRERGMPPAAENRKLSHVQRKKSNLTRLHRNFKIKSKGNNY